MNTEEIHLLNGVLLGDPSAADQFVRKYTRFVYSVIYEYSLQPPDAADIHQRVFLRLWDKQMQALREWKGTGTFVSYLGSIVRNMVVTELRAQSNLRLSPVDSVPPPAVSPPSTRMIVHDALNKLSPRDRELICLKHFEGLSYREIAERLGMTVNNVGVSLSRAETRLRGFLQSHV